MLSVYSNETITIRFIKWKIIDLRKKGMNRIPFRGERSEANINSGIKK